MATIGWFNRLDAATATDALLACCASQGWAQQVIAGRPYGDREELLGAGDNAFASLDAQALRVAVDAHPRIGERPGGGGREAGGTSTAHDAAWSRQEQSGVVTTPRTEAELVEANAAYERRFGHVFLICATGLTTPQILAEARRRFDNDPATEWTEVTRELGRIVRLRLGKLVVAG